MNAMYMSNLTKPQRKAVYKVFVRYCHPDNTHPLTITSVSYTHLTLPTKRIV